MLKLTVFLRVVVLRCARARLNADYWSERGEHAATSVFLLG